MEQVRQDQFDGQSEKKQKSALLEILESVAIAVLLAVLIRMFLFQPFIIPSESMYPTLQISDRIMVNKLSYHLGDPSRGDVIVFKYPMDPSRDFVKRLIAVGGETIEVRDSVLFINDEPVSEAYLPSDLDFNDFGPVEVPPGTYFMMGDNRNSSEDSRSWGMLPEENIIGKAVVIYWPVNRIELL
ncbi:MAG TPA: signal peptidase I [Desulfotomaculum sp.]|nr:MAG: signal peptidase I [Desulfotomaculum sp. BICA1-6]HBX22369.1 signal peptidase I [Desulfotomaculum sp.]